MSRSVSILAILTVIMCGSTIVHADTLSNLTNISAVTVPGSTETIANGINDNGIIVGAYRDAQSGQNEIGFIDKANIFTSIIYPGASQTSVEGVNNMGQVVGTFYSSDANYQAFVESSGTFSPLFITGAVNSAAYDINSSGQTVGYYTDSSGLQHGFICSNNSCNPINVPGAVDTDALGINDHGDVAGWFLKNGVSRGFTYNTKTGAFTTFSVLGTTSTTGVGINNLNQVVGHATPVGKSQGNGEEGFIYTGSAYYSLDLPGSLSTFVDGINDQDQIVAFNGNGSFEAQVVLKTPIKTPEPSSIFLLIIGMAALLGLTLSKSRLSYRT